MTIFMHEDRTMPVYRLDTHRPLPAGCGKQGRHRTRGHGTEQEADTVILDDDELARLAVGSADPLGDDQAERSSWGGLFDDSRSTSAGPSAHPITAHTHAGWWVAAVAMLAALCAGWLFTGA